MTYCMSGMDGGCDHFARTKTLCNVCQQSVDKTNEDAERKAISDARRLLSRHGFLIVEPVDGVVAGLSWGGYNVYGDRRSIDRVSLMRHSHDIVVPSLQAEIQRLRRNSLIR
jgi:hypothetical protein